MKTIPMQFAAFAFVPMFATACASSIPHNQAQVRWAISTDSVEHAESEREPIAFEALDARLGDDLEQHFVLREHVPAALSFHCVDADGLPTCAAKPAVEQ